MSRYYDYFILLFVSGMADSLPKRGPPQNLFFDSAGFSCIGICQLAVRRFQTGMVFPETAPGRGFFAVPRISSHVTEAPATLFLT